MASPVAYPPDKIEYFTWGFITDRSEVSQICKYRIACSKTGVKVNIEKILIVVRICRIIECAVLRLVYVLPGMI